MFADEKRRSKRWIFLVVAGILVVWFFVTSSVSVPPQSVIPVYGPSGIYSLVNEGNEARRMWKWPYIPGTSVGVKEEVVELLPKDITVKFAFYTTEDVTGKPEHKEYAQAYYVDVKVKVEDWQKFLSEINLDEINEARKKAGPFVRLVKDRFEVVALPVMGLIEKGETTDRFGKPLKTEEGYPPMNVRMVVDYARQEMTSRRNLAIMLIDFYGYETVEEVIEHLKNKEPWLFFAGSATFEFLANQHKEIMEYTQVPYIKGISLKAAHERFVFGTDRLELYRQAYQAYQYEEFLTNIKEVENQRERLTTLYPETEKVARSFHVALEVDKNGLKLIQSEEQLSSVYDMFLKQIQWNLALVFRKEKLEDHKKMQREFEKTRLPSFTDDQKSQGEVIVRGFKAYIRQQAGREVAFWEYTAEMLNQAFKQYSTSKGIPDTPALEYASYLIVKELVEGLEEVIEKAFDFMDKIEIVKEFYDDITARLPAEVRKALEIAQINLYLQEKGELFQNSFSVITLDWQKEKLLQQKKQWEASVRESLIPFFKHYLESDEELAMNIRRVSAEQNEALWRVAIGYALEGEKIAQYEPFWIYEIEEGDTLASLAEKYQVGWEEVFGMTSRYAVYQSLPLEKKVEFNKLLTEGIESGDYEKAYEMVKDTPLKQGITIYIYKVKQYSQDWFPKQKKGREEREKVINSYLYKYAEEVAPGLAKEFIEQSPWIEYLEDLYGVKIEGIEIRIGKERIFTEGGTVKEEFYELYNERFVNER